MKRGSRRKGESILELNHDVSTLLTDDSYQSLELFLVDFERLRVHKLSIIRSFIHTTDHRWMYAFSGNPYVHDEKRTFRTAEKAKEVLINHCRRVIDKHQDAITLLTYK